MMGCISLFLCLVQKRVDNFNRLKQQERELLDYISEASLKLLIQ